MKKNFVLKWVITLLVIYVGWCGILYTIQEKFIFFPSSEYANFPVPGEMKWENVSIPTKDGETLEGFWLDNKAEKTVIFFHGNGGNISHRIGQLFFFHKLGLNALIFDYRGFGKSTGNITQEKDLYVDGQGGLDFLEGKNIFPENIILWGESLGTGVAVELAQEKDFWGLVLDAPFLSLEKTAQSHYWFLPIRYVLKYRLANDEKIKNISSPILIFHSTEDEIASFQEGKELFDLAQEPKKFIETKGTHNRALAQSIEQYLSALQDFLK